LHRGRFKFLDGAIDYAHSFGLTDIVLFFYPPSGAKYYNKLKQTPVILLRIFSGNFKRRGFSVKTITRHGYPTALSRAAYPRQGGGTVKIRLRNALTQLNNVDINECKKIYTKRNN